MVEKMHHNVGQQIGNYSLIQLLGRGGFADVYLGEHIYLKTQAAIKVLRVQLSASSRDDFLNEARTIAKLEHPNIVRVLECGITGEHTPFLVMAYAPNGSLRQRHTKGARLPLVQVLPYIQQIAAALYYAHQHKLIHRDVKPENMLIGQHNELLLSDFGLALLAQSSSAQSTKEMAGTAPYMSPEQLQGKPRYASDQYALAIAAYEWLCGERPFNGTFMEIASQQVLSPPPSLCAKVLDLPPEVEQVIFRALAKEPAERYEDVLAFSQALTDASLSAESRAPLVLSSLSTAKSAPSGQLSFERSSNAPSFSAPGQPSLVLSAPSPSLAGELSISLTDLPTATMARSRPNVTPNVSMSTITPLHLSDMVTASSAVVTPPLLPTPSAIHQRQFWQLIVLFTIALTLLGGSIGLWFGQAYLSHMVPMHFRHRIPATATYGETNSTATVSSGAGSGETTPGSRYTVTATASPPDNHNMPPTPLPASPTIDTGSSMPGNIPTPVPTPEPPTPTPMPTEKPATPTPEPPTPTPVPTEPPATPTPIETRSTTPTTQSSEWPVQQHLRHRRWKRSHYQDNGSIAITD